MARLFNGVDQWLETSSAPVLTPPFSFNCWFYVPDTLSNYTTTCLGEVGVGGTSFARLVILGSSDLLRYQVSDGVTAANAESTITVTPNEWHMATGVSYAVNDHRVWLDGGNSNQSVSQPAPTFNSFAIGRIQRESPSNYMLGRVCRVSVWDTGLIQADVDQLWNDGLARDNHEVRLDNLRLDAKLLDDDADINWAGDGTFDMSAFGSPTYGEHVPLLSPVSHFGFPEEGPPPAQKLSLDSTSNVSTLGDADVTSLLSLDSASTVTTLGDIDVEVAQKLSLDSESTVATLGDADVTSLLSLDSESTVTTLGTISVGPEVGGIDIPESRLCRVRKRRRECKVNRR